MRDNVRTGWAAERYSPLQWSGFAIVFGLFEVLGVVVLVGGSTVVGVACLIPFAALAAISLVQAVRSRG